MNQRPNGAAARDRWPGSPQEVPRTPPGEVPGLPSEVPPQVPEVPRTPDETPPRPDEGPQPSER